MKREYYATGVYVDGKLIVKKGSLIRKCSSSEYKRAKVVQKYRNDKESFNDSLILEKDIEFNSPSTAAQFVVDTITNGYKLWKTEDGITLKDYLKKFELENK